MTIIKILNDRKNETQKMLKSKKIKETKREGQPKGLFRRDKKRGRRRE